MQAPSTRRVRRRSCSSPTASLDADVPCGCRSWRTATSTASSSRADPMHPLLVRGVGEERPVAAASVIAAGPDAVAALTEDAGPPGAQPGQIGADDVLRVGRIDELDPLPGEIQHRLRGCVDRRRPAVRAVTTASALRGPLRSTPCGWGSWMWVPTRCTSWWSTRTAAPSRRRTLSQKTVLRLAEHIYDSGRLSRGRVPRRWSPRSPRPGTERARARCDDLLAFATSAVRDARTSTRCSSTCAKETGVELRC